MTFFGALYKLLIGPLELFFEIIFVIANRLIGNLGLSIIVLSLVMNFLVLPLYKRADAMQEEQRETEKRLKKWVTHIKKAFKGDERFMMLQTYYRQNNYKPTSILKGSVSLLLEIPFFIAAYNFLSHAGVFNGFSFGPFADLGKPDGLIKIAGFSINLLPILMTTINIISSAIYTKGLPTSSKVQLYGMAGIFLILLYDSPAALVFYWTLNNLFSLVKNLFYKLKNPKFVFGILSSTVGVIALIFVLFIHRFDSIKKNVFVIGFSLLLHLPLILYFLKDKIRIERKININKNDKVIFYVSAAFLAVLTGLLIPSTVINSSPEEFINTVTFANPLNYVLNSALIAIGTFLIWFSIFYALANNKGKKIIEVVVCSISLCSIINYMFFGKKYGTLSHLLMYENKIKIDKIEALINLCVLVITVALFILIWIKKNNIVKYIFQISTICILGMSIFNCIHSNVIVSSKLEKLRNSPTETATIPLSKNGKNVIILMMDRAINSYIPYIFNEKPEVAKQFEGFTYYPNTITFGGHTNFGLPGVFGGYEYTPKEMNKRTEESLESKHNEAMKVMPVLFSEKDFVTTVCDPSYAGYDWIPDLSIYDDYPKISKYITMDGSIGNSKEENETEKTIALNRNFFVYSLTKICPIVFQPTMYNDGNYNRINKIEQITKGKYEATGYNSKFVNSYNVLKYLPTITKINDNEDNTFLMMCNDTTHSPCLLQEPDYVPMASVNNKDFEKTCNDQRINANGEILKIKDLNSARHYQVNVAAMIQLGNYFDYLRENDIYDNTKIIIVSDHGYSTKQFENLILGEGDYDDVLLYNPLLMVKDFNSKEFTTDSTFMTNADVPTLALKDVIEDPVNPFTNKPINNEAKNSDKQYIIASHEWHTDINNGNTFLPSPWYSVHDNIFDLNNWNKMEEWSVE